MQTLTRYLTLLVFFSFIGLAHGVAVKHPEILETGVAVSANSTNSTASTAYTFSNEEVPGMSLLTLAVYGTAGATNGTYTLVLAKSTDGVVFDTGSQSYSYISVTPSGTATNQVSMKIDLSGCQAIRVDNRQNTSLGACTNIVTLSIQSQK